MPLSILTLSLSRSTTMPTVVSEPGRTFFPLFFPIGSSWSRTILALSPGPGSNHDSWNMANRILFPQLWAPEVDRKALGLLGSWFSLLLEALGNYPACSAPDLGTHYNLVMGWQGERERRDSLTKMGSSNQIIKETFKSRLKRLKINATLRIWYIILAFSF